MWALEKRPHYWEFLTLQHAVETAQWIDDSHLDLPQEILDRYEVLESECFELEKEYEAKIRDDYLCK